MDGLALLCALHADGPQSLRRLRRSGCPSLESVAELDVERLAELLASSPTAAQRFQREAHHLLARLGSSAKAHPESALLEDEALDGAASESTGAKLAAAVPALSASALSNPALSAPALSAPAPSAHAPVVRAQGGLQNGSLGGSVTLHGAQAAQKAYDAVLAQWRNLDAMEDAQSVAEPIVEESSAPAPHPSPRTPLSVLQDLADESRDALCAAGILDLEDLAACDALQLSRATGLDYSNAVRWRSLARRALPTGQTRFSLADRPQVQRSERAALEDATRAALEQYVLRPAPRSEVADPAQANGHLRTRSTREETAGGPFA